MGTKCGLGAGARAVAAASRSAVALGLWRPSHSAARFSIDMPDHLFVYGTLLPGRGPKALRPVLDRLRDVGPGTTCGRLYHLGRYPGCKLIEGDEFIAGRVLELPDDPAVLDALDRYEGYDPANAPASLFIRKRCQVRAEDGRVIDAWVYEYNRDLGSATRIATGSYADWKKTDPGPWD